MAAIYGNDLSQTAAGITEAWKRQGEELVAWPARFAHVHGVKFPMSTNAITFLTRLLPRLRSLHTLVSYDAYAEQAPGYEAQEKAVLVALAKCGPLPKIKHLQLPFSNGTRYDLFRSLHNMPNLETLKAVATHDPQGWDRKTQPPSLPHLQSLEIFGVAWAEIVWPLLAKAPRLQDLSISMAHAWRPARSDRSDAIFRSQQIRTLTLGDHMTVYVAGNATIPDWMPNLDILTLEDSLQASQMPRHPNLRLLNFRLNDSEYSTDGYIATAPTPGSTLRLDDWLVAALDKLPKLMYLDDYNGDDGPQFSSTTVDKAIETGYRVVTFTDGQDTLVHIRKRARYLSPVSIRGYYPWRRRLHASRYLGGQYDGEQWIFGHHEADEEPEAYSQGPSISAAEQDKIDTESLDLTSFKGRELPCTLLDYVYVHSAKEREWSEGGRGLELPEHVWQLLRDWHEEVIASEACSS